MFLRDRYGRSIRYNRYDIRDMKDDSFLFEYGYENVKTTVVIDKESLKKYERIFKISKLRENGRGNTETSY